MDHFTRRRELLTTLAAAPGLLVPWAASAQAPFIPQEGTEYQTVAHPQPTDSPGKVEVLDFFWYGCPHCYHLLPELEAWRKRKPADVAFKHVPVDFGDASREAHTRLFYALQALGKVDELHVKVFDAYHRDRHRLLDPKEIADFMAANGIDRDKWNAAFNSFAVANQTQRAHALAQAYAIEGTPTLAIDGRFVTAPSMVASQADPNRAVIATLDFVIERVRRERRGARRP